ncbi:aspartate aminotransferase family protein [Tsukamurella tyrosinosolvens]|uniref:aminotransferase family protein n=2 Tax=Tsukamurella tyrosinosolvens TaxID=57704 RepID=UPI00079AEB3D|nr:aminotransferase class III-fold pyridoxal phosphate-dependent enzyme [Tsukamurella tyrosinosolvens]AUN40252.1 aspartate aminotransferase family protein [Tsukamurella tyrosinosolvens]KXP05700.1 adenosylmethionine-8-amino-7-oxononanoate aminotransferase [Tsukamurella tyrosinosolvens]MCA4993701.1 aspartate aminotransferase family protein [Tsukamurella tyrosinosolvens]MEC4614124.1 aminotransferase class III-fold pyridoxal phosphate-dependent enzyme [Tsukamurella tyrosinosolvens]QRY82987.1 aspar
MSGQGPTTSSALWHGFADMGAVQRDGAFVFARGEGAYVFDTEGNRYLDATAGLWFANVGHGRAEVADAVRDQLLKVAHVTGFGDAATDTTVALAERLQGIAPVPDSKIFFTSGGSDSVDSAIKLARRYWQEKGRPEKKLIVGRSNAYHGMHVGGTSLGGIPVNAEGYGGVLFDDTATVAWDDAKELLGLIERVGAEAIAAFVAEPVIGAGGLLPPPEGYLREVRDICREHDVLFIADEVITGFGRIGGAWFASSRFDLEPDLMTTAKGLTSGYVPMGALFVAPHVAEPFFAGGVWWRHGYTYGGHAAAAAASMAVLDIMERENLVAEALRLQDTLLRELSALADHPKVKDVRGGVGAVAGVQLHEPAEAMAMVKKLRAQGVSGRAAGLGTLQYSPALITTDEQVAEIAAATRRALDA